MKTLIENLCDKLEDWGIDPITLAKAIAIFLLIVLVIGLMFIFPIVLKIVSVIAICAFFIVLIYLMLE
jgi:hypothetical protein